MPRYGKILKSEVTPYHILDVMQDPAYMKHFYKRFQMQKETTEAMGKKAAWIIFYRDEPDLLYKDAIDEIKRMLGEQESSASLVKFVGAVRDIVLNACSDWITEKTGRDPEFEILPNTIKCVKMDLSNYGPNKKKQRRSES